MDSTQLNHPKDRESPSVASEWESIPSREEVFLEEVTGVIKAHLAKEEFTVSILAERVKLSVSQLNRRLKAHVDISGGQLIRNVRLEHAALLLSHNAAPVAVIAAQVGFKNQGNFCRSFKKQYGCTPSKFKQQQMQQKY